MRFALFCASVVLILAGSAVYMRPATTQAPLREQRLLPDTSWMTEKWNGDERPYIAIRDGINKDFLNGDLTVPYLSNLEQRWHKNEQSPFALFRWAYARYRSYAVRPHLPFTPLPGRGAFDEIASPHSYYYARIRFLTEASLGSHPELMEVGKRLLARNPNDFDVEYCFTNCFPQSMSASEKEAALAYSTHLIEKYPKKPDVYTTKAGIYFAYWIDHKSKQDAQDAILWYQRYLQIARPDDAWQPRAKGIISLLKSRV